MNKEKHNRYKKQRFARPYLQDNFVNLLTTTVTVG